MRPSTRLPYPERDRLTAARVAVVGCGALGSGVARLLARSGVGHLVLIDPEPLGWERTSGGHQLGAGAVGLPKATTLAQAVAHENPDIGSARASRLLGRKPAGARSGRRRGCRPCGRLHRDLVRELRAGTTKRREAALLSFSPGWRRMLSPRTLS